MHSFVALIYVVRGSWLGLQASHLTMAMIVTALSQRQSIRTAVANSYNVLFLCTGNSGRSIFAESILRKDGAGRFKAYSAGSNPKGDVSPWTFKVLQWADYPSSGLTSKNWDEFSKPGAPEMDFIFTVCDDAAGETCPVWTGHPATAHWGIEDPAKATGSEVDKEAAYIQAFKYLKNRIDAFVNLPIDSLDRMALHQHLHDIGRMAGATAPRG